MTNNPPDDVEIPNVLYPCSDGNCADEHSYPPEDLHWVPEWQGWYCQSCIEFSPDGLPDGSELGPTLAEWPAVDLRAMEILDAEVADHRERMAARSTGDPVRAGR